jgi:hypothetical protein
VGTATRSHDQEVAPRLSVIDLNRGRHSLSLEAASFYLDIMYPTTLHFSLQRSSQHGTHTECSCTLRCRSKRYAFVDIHLPILPKVGHANVQIFPFLESRRFMTPRKQSISPLFRWKAASSSRRWSSPLTHFCVGWCASPARSTIQWVPEAIILMKLTIHYPASICGRETVRPHNSGSWNAF